MVFMPLGYSAPFSSISDRITAIATRFPGQIFFNVRPGLITKPGPLPLWDNKSNHKQKYFHHCQGYVDTIRNPFPESVNQRGSKEQKNTEVMEQIHFFSFRFSRRCLKALILLPYSPVIINPTRSIPVAAPSEKSETACKAPISASPV